MIYKRNYKGGRDYSKLKLVKKGHAYCLILGSAGCDRSGEGFAIYVNGKLLTQSKGGFLDT